MKRRLIHDSLSPLVLSRLSNRDVALWIGPGVEAEVENIERLGKLIELPWSHVLCESSNSSLSKWLEESGNSQPRLVRRRGFVHPIYSNPEGLELPPRSLPVYFLNGRDDANERNERSDLTVNAMLMRRLNMIHRLEVAKPASLVVLSFGGESPIKTLIDLWQEGFRSHFVIYTNNLDEISRIDDWMAQSGAPPAIDHCTGPFDCISDELIAQANILLPEDRYTVRVRTSSGGSNDIDITDCELSENPILDRYDVILSRDIISLGPEDLSSDELNSFFGGSDQSWRPYAANLPWERDTTANLRLESHLKKLIGTNGEQATILAIASESGAGGSTRARTLGMFAARLGFPTMVAKAFKFKPKVTELERYFFEIRKLTRNIPEVGRNQLEANVDSPTADVPWMLIFDIQHWEGRSSELIHFTRTLSRSGQAILVLVVTGMDATDELTSAPNFSTIDVLMHELQPEDAVSLGRHLNRFLRIHGKEKTESQWSAFWERHRPINVDVPSASFWITLEFWLRGQFDMTESIQSWVSRQYFTAEMTNDMRMLLLEITALSVERQPYPEALLPSSAANEFPYSHQLMEVRSELPSLSLVRAGAPPFSQWILAHDLIGRHLLAAVFGSRAHLASLGFSNIEDAAQLRLGLLRRIATRPELARRNNKPLAIEFAVNILKLGTDGNLDFARYWKTVLEIFESMSMDIWDTSRSFNHHVAISRRRVAVSDTIFRLTLEEKKSQLVAAIEHVEYALLKLNRSDEDDESAMNLLNTLSLAYQNLAEFEREAGADESRLTELRDKATDAARRAQSENPSNSYVLETFARNLLQNGQIYPDLSTKCAAEALAYIYQAMQLDRSLLREEKLATLAGDAIAMLRADNGDKELERICASGNPLGFLGRALLALLGDGQRMTKEILVSIPAERLDQALDIIDQAPERLNPLLLRFRYDLIVSKTPRAFEKQLDLLDELEGLPGRVPLQLQLEHAILLHQRNRHPDATKRYNFIRKEFRRRDEYLDVPQRLRWLITEDGKHRLCVAQVVEDGDLRSKAKVRELRDLIIPFRPQEFGNRRMAPGTTFTCSINFGVMGPFIKPPTSNRELE